jgi:hypothetical protein
MLAAHIRRAGNQFGGKVLWLVHVLAAQQQTVQALQLIGPRFHTFARHQLAQQ